MTDIKLFRNNMLNAENPFLVKPCPALLRTRGMSHRGTLKDTSSLILWVRNGYLQQSETSNKDKINFHHLQYQYQYQSSGSSFTITRSFFTGLASPSSFTDVASRLPDAGAPTTGMCSGSGFGDQDLSTLKLRPITGRRHLSIVSLGKMGAAKGCDVIFCILGEGISASAEALRFADRPSCLGFASTSVSIW